MANIEVNDVAIRSLDGAAVLVFLDEGRRQTIARPQSHRTQYRLRLRLTQVVILEVTIAVLVEQIAAFGACGFGDQNPGEWQARRMILDELHILERYTGLI